MKTRHIIGAIMLMAAMTFTGCGSKEQNGKDNSGLFVIREGGTNGKFGFIDKTGKVVIEPQYDYVEPFSEGMARVEVGDKWGFVDEKGKLVIAPQFDAAHDFSEGLAGVKIGKNWGFIDKAGKMVIPSKFYDDYYANGNFFYNFHDGMAIVKLRDEGDYRNGYINKKGEVVVEVSASLPGNFVNGIAISDNKIIDKTGKVLANTQYDQIFRIDGDIIAVDRNVGYMIIDKSGSPLTGYLDFLPYYSEGLAIIKVDGKVGYADKTGKVVIEPKFDDGGSFSEGLASVRVDDKWGYIDKKGQYVINPQFEWAGNFSEGLAEMSVDRKSGFIDKTGKVVIAPQFVKVDDFSGGLALFHDGLAGFQWQCDTWGYVDKTGKIVYSAECDNHDF